MAMQSFLGRQTDIALFDKIFAQGKSQIVAVYGRRRVGKTALIQHVAQNRPAWLFEAIESEGTAGQIKHFLKQLADFVHEPHLADLAYTDWPPVFDLLTKQMKQQPSLIICFDEFTWMAAGRTKMVSLIKFYWDREWKNNPHLVLILCGSVTSWMIKNVVRSKALYGRISRQILVEPLKPFEVAQFIGRKRGQREILEYLLCFGGIPKYLEEFDFNKSIQLNIEQTCFQPSGFFVEEAQKIFYTQFKETQIYRQISQILLNGPLSLQQVADKIKTQSGGGLKLYLENLAATNLIEALPVITNFQVGKVGRYHFIDEFLRFHHQFMGPHLMEIKKLAAPRRFEKFVHQQWYPFLGLAFERFCLKHRYVISFILDFYDKLIACGPCANLKKGGYQFDLVFVRRDAALSVCEIKYVTEPLKTTVIKEFEDKLTRVSWPRGITIEKILITNVPPSQPLADSGYFHHIVTGEQMVKMAY